LSAQQQAWLKRWYRRSRCAPTVRIEVADRADHRTALDLQLPPGLTTGC
jgi:hypothetical protein